MKLMAPRARTDSNNHLSRFPGLGLRKDGRYYFQNPYTGRQTTLKTKDLKQAIARWALAKALSDKAYGDQATTHLAQRLQESNTPVSKGSHIHLCDFLKKWRVEVLEQGKVTIKIKRNEGQPLAPRTQKDYTKQAKQLEKSPDAKFALSHPQSLQKIRILIAPWALKATTYNHLKAMLGRMYDHAVLVGLIDKNPMRDIDKLPVQERKVLVPDDAYIRITEQLLIHKENKRDMDGTWRVKICDLMYMFSQQPIDLFALRISQFHLEAIDKSDSNPINWKHGEIHLARSKTSVGGIIEMNAEMRAVVDWLMDFRKEQFRLAKNVFKLPTTDHLLIYPNYMKRVRLQPLKHRTFSDWWRKARAAAKITEDYWLMDMRKKGLTDEYVSQGDNEKGLHATDAMKWHYRLIVPPKRSKNTLTSIRSRAVAK
ncbi:MAG: hypothetical protein Q8L20_11120 [Gammaproteobacteria bacterium]|nr:hypothetical protein [Gammaproteobacteria bacterium]